MAKVVKEDQDLEMTEQQSRSDTAEINAENQYCKLTVMAIGVHVEFVKQEIKYGKTTKDFDPPYIKSGCKGSGEWRGGWGTPSGTEGDLYFTVNDGTDHFKFSFDSPYTGKNMSDLVTSDMKSGEFDVSFIEQGNTSRSGPLGTVVIAVQRKN